MSSDALQTLRQVNDSLRAALARFRPEQTLSSKITAGDLSGVLAELLRAGECLRNLAAQNQPSTSATAEEAAALAEETRAYQANLEKLKRFLPDLHARLLAEKARLETAQTHVAAASAWARASGKTL
jgi:F0F1-type ATP synthase alpha subunit